MSSELVKELRKASSLPTPLIGAPIMRDAAARIEALEAALEPFAGIAELVDLETEGLSDTDTFDLMFHDYLLDRFTLAHFRAARRAREGGNDG